MLSVYYYSKKSILRNLQNPNSKQYFSLYGTYMPKNRYPILALLPQSFLLGAYHRKSHAFNSLVTEGVQFQRKM